MDPMRALSNSIINRATAQKASQPMQAYSDNSRESDPHALPDLEIFQLTAREVAEQDEDLIYDYMKQRRFRLASMNSRVRDAMLNTMIEEEGIQGGWFWWYCLPGCLPDSTPFGPYATCEEAKTAAQDDAQAF
jgi:hypothetical protein